MKFVTTVGLLSVALAACVRGQSVSPTPLSTLKRPDTLAIVAVGRALSADSMRGRGPWTEDATRAARYLAARLQQLGARPVFGTSLLVPFVTADHPRDTVYNVVGVFPNRRGSTAGDVVAMTAHLDHLGVGKPDASGDSIYNGFLDDALSTGMILDVARRYVQAPGGRPLVIMFFNLEEQGLLGAQALAARSDAGALIARMRLLVGVDAGSPAGEAMQWQIMGGLPANHGAQLADSLARARGWTTTSTVPRPINDVYVFAQRGVPIVFPIPGATWRGYTTAQRAEAMSKFDHYHQPADEWRPDFPLVGTAYYADWLWSIIHAATDAHTPL
jgi:hypothetical protein